MIKLTSCTFIRPCS